MLPVLLMLMLLGALCSSGQAMSREEKHKLRWVNTFRVLCENKTLCLPKGCYTCWFTSVLCSPKEPSGWDVWPCLSELHGKLSIITHLFMPSKIAWGLIALISMNYKCLFVCHPGPCISSRWADASNMQRKSTWAWTQPRWRRWCAGEVSMEPSLFL